MFLLIFYVPKTHLEEVKKVLFAKGAGRYEKYDMCSWEVLGKGQFRPLAGSEPFTGDIGKIKRIDEYRVEILCRKDILKNVVDELISVHPYQEPAYYVIELEKL